MTTDIRRADRRFHTNIDWLDSRHSFSFGPHYDPANTHFGMLMVCNDDVVKAGTGFETHPHRDMEIVTWVLSGSLVHQDSTPQQRCRVVRRQQPGQRRRRPLRVPTRARPSAVTPPRRPALGVCAAQKVGGNCLLHLTLQ